MKWMVRIFTTGFFLFVLFQMYYFVQIIWWVNYPPSSTAFMREQLGVLRKKNPSATIQQKWVPYTRIARAVKRAIIASEDARFSEHDGLDWQALEQAYQKNIKKGRLVMGGSTITQQLAKNLFLSSEKSYVRKVQECLITWMLEAVMDKERILEIYLNVVEWGNGIFGIEAAARHYYGVSAFQLSNQQAARLAVMLPNPRFYDKHPQSRYLEKRSAIILKRMMHADVP